ncbi:DNA polymerase III subunit beta [[Bacillus] enclensis]|uniref:Beta sliding clamp n=1 Tax=[Bacillus] enclensis TaxID=1402860 RepID=A0A0V8HKC6_9BACI|nr:DNA polymerase III subunit beta [[Bacillus] enclensis]KSU63129.1 DNA polymerase III subunit beta [[Bacillus] enclensis]SCB78830.1 DNA polymerase III beta subunit family protein [[Bacillus] enclensis]
MELSINSECFHKAISEVSKAVSLKTPFPILTGIKITAEEDALVLIGSNSDLIIEKKIPLTIDGARVLEVKQTGSVVVTAKYISEIVKKLPGDIHVKADGKQLITLQSGEIITSLKGFPSEEYPNMPVIDESSPIRIPSTELLEMIKQTAFAVAKNESRPVLTGVNLFFKENHLTCAATNSHRLALRELKIDSNIRGSFIIPSTSINELVKLIPGETEIIHIFLSDSYIVFKTADSSLFSRLIEGNYPNVSALIPKDSKTVITLDTKQFLKGIDRACLFASEWKNNNVHLEIINGSRLKISSTSSEIGRIEETQPFKNIEGGSELSISLDANFMIDSLKAIKEEEINVSFGGSMKPILIEPVGNPSCLHLISPVRSY